MLLAVTLGAAAPALAWTHALTYYRGNAALWSRDKVTWSHNGLKITSGTASQGCGYPFPSRITAKGVRAYKPNARDWYYTSTQHASSRRCSTSRGIKAARSVFSFGRDVQIISPLPLEPPSGRSDAGMLRTTGG